MRIKDEHGNVLGGIDKSATGVLVVDNMSDYHKYTKERERAKKVADLENQVAQLTDLVQKLLEKNNG